MATADWTFSPLGEFDRLRRQMDELFGRFGMATGLAGGFPGTNVYDQGDEFLVAVQAPGLSRDDLNVEVRENVLTVAGKRDVAVPEGAEPLRQERAGGEFRRSLRLPSKVRNDGVEAHFKDGILRIRIPKAEDAKSRQIAINA